MMTCEVIFRDRLRSAMSNALLGSGTGRVGGLRDAI